MPPDTTVMIIIVAIIITTNACSVPGVFIVYSACGVHGVFVVHDIHSKCSVPGECYTPEIFNTGISLEVTERSGLNELR